MSCCAARFDQVADYVDGLLGGDAAVELERHMVACQTCRAEVDEQRALLARMRSVPVDGQRRDHLIAGLLDLGELPDARGDQSVRCPATVTSDAPPQYISPRRSVACAMVALAGCAGVALVAAHVPVVSTGGTSTFVNRQVVSPSSGAQVVHANRLGGAMFVQVAGYQSRP